MGMGVLRDSCARTFRRLVEIIVIAQVVGFQFSTALGQESIIFQYLRPGTFSPTTSLSVAGAPNAAITEILKDNITFLGNFFPTARNDATSGKCFYKRPVQLFRKPDSVASFSTMFDVSMIQSGRCVDSQADNSSVQGLAFFLASDDSIDSGNGGYLGWLNSTSNNRTSTPYNFAVEVDFFQDAQFQDPMGVHIGVNKNSLTSVTTSGVPWEGVPFLESNRQIRLSMWIEYDSSTQILQVFGTESGGPVFGGIASKPEQPILSTSINLTDTIYPQGMFVGLSGSSPGDSDGYGGNILYTVDVWTFNSDGPAPDFHRKADGTVFEKDPELRRRVGVLKSSLVSIVLFVFFILLFAIFVLYARFSRLAAITRTHNIEEGLLSARGPQVFKYKVLRLATKGFGSQELLGSGGFGSVYRGTLILKGDSKPTDVAVKRISSTSKQGAREFSAEVKIIGRAQHRNLVRLLGWCHEKGELLLVYEYMPNGSVDKHLYRRSENLALGEPTVLTWARRLKIVSGVARALAFLHEEWEQRVIHRDVKSSNVMLDRDFNARLGDFGLARICEHDQTLPKTTVLVGTRGYMAPEFIQTLKATEKTDVYSFGALVLELATGKRPMLSLEDQELYDEGLLVDWVWGLYKNDALLDAVDRRLENAYDQGEMVMVLKIGLLCSHPDPDERPTMMEVIHIWKGLSPFPRLPLCKPTPFSSSFDMRNSLLLSSSVYADSNTVTSVDHAIGQGDELMAGRTSTSSNSDSTITSESDDRGSSLWLDWDRAPSVSPPLHYRHSNTTSLPF